MDLFYSSRSRTTSHNGRLETTVDDDLPVDDLSVDDPSVDDLSVDDPSVDDPFVDNLSVDDLYVRRVEGLDIVWTFF